MIRYFIYRLLCCTLLLGLATTAVRAQSEECLVEGSSRYKLSDPLTLWYLQPARSNSSANPWMEYALPIGNGQFGAMLYGGVCADEIQFNEKTLWSGRPTDLGADYGNYQNFGSVFIDDISGQFDRTGNKTARNYIRQLNLSEGLGYTTFDSPDGSVTYDRAFMIPEYHNVLCGHFRASVRGKISLRFRLEAGSPGLQARTVYQGREAHFQGRLETVAYYAGMRLTVRGGSVRTTSEGIEVRDANEVILYLSALTNFDADAPNQCFDPVLLPAKAKEYLDAASQKGFAPLYSDHATNYLYYLDACALQLDGAKNDLPTDQLIDRYNAPDASEAHKRMLEMLYFAYGRYLAIASSRGVSLPSNLQGIWNNLSEAPWHSDIHSNINVQMNYWPVENTNLSKLHEPFLNYIIRMSQPGGPWEKYAKSVGQERGWTCFTENNIFGGCGPFMHNYVIANAWYATHLWQHYLYTRDLNYLQRAYPTMLSAAQFWMDRLKQDPADGLYVCPQEYSPEHGPTEDGVSHAQQLVSELLDEVSQATRILGSKAPITKADKQRLEFLRKNVDRGLRTETYTGTWGEDIIPLGTPILREWKHSAYDNPQAQPLHRHLSHLMVLYPFRQITKGSPLFDAAVNSLRLRGDESTGWSMGWKINLWARAHDGNHAHKILQRALRHATSFDCDASRGGIYYNLFDAHAPFQIDGNLGATAGMAEMLMQSYGDTIEVLPALPDAWPTGSVRGLKAIGGYTVELHWASGKLTRVDIQLPLAETAQKTAQKVFLLLPDQRTPQAQLAESPVPLKRDKAGLVCATLKPGQTFTLTY